MTYPFSWWLIPVGHRQCPATVKLEVKRVSTNGLTQTHETFKTATHGSYGTDFQSYTVNKYAYSNMELVTEKVSRLRKRNKEQATAELISQMDLSSNICA